MHMQNIAIILAGGSGKRAQSDIPKQFLKIQGKTILEYSVEKFDTMPAIDEITIVIHPAWQKEGEQLLSRGQFKKIKHIIAGGSERYHSVMAALKLYPHPCHLLIHDAVRPLVSHQIIRDVLDNLLQYEAVNVGIPATDTIVQVDTTHSFITGIPDRNFLFQVQTPQGFRSETLKKAYALALSDPHFTTTDDCGVVKKYLPEKTIKIVRGETSNIKLTYPEDLPLLALLLSQNTP